MEVVKQVEYSRSQVRSKLCLCSLYICLPTQEAVNVSLKNLLTYPYVKERVKGGGLHIHGMHYNLRHGRLTSWDIVRK